MSRRASTWVRFVGSALAFVVLAWRLGTGPFLDGLRSVNGEALAAASAIAVVTTVCYGWRWKIVARGLGVDLPLRAAVAAYYRSMFLNVTLPGGIVGDVHRGMSHGRAVNDLGRAMRSVVWERFAGQVLQVLVTVAVLLVLPSPVRSAMPLVAIAVVVALLCLVLATRARPDDARSRLGRLVGAAAGDIRKGLLVRRAWPGIAVTSPLILAGHAATFLIAARAAGVTAPASRMLPLALLVIAAMVLPSVGGWGPREGVAAWVFGAAGLGAQHGVATAVVFGVMALVASLPGAAVIAVGWLRPAGAPRRAAQLRRRPARA